MGKYDCTSLRLYEPATAGYFHLGFCAMSTGTLVLIEPVR